MIRYTLHVNNQEFSVDSRRVSIGRGLDNTIVLSDPSVSGHHAAVCVSNGQVVIQDLGSTNGTFINRASVGQGRILSPGDVVQIGNSTLLLSIRDSAGVSASRSWLPMIVIAASVAAIFVALIVASRDGFSPAAHESSASRPVAVRPAAPLFPALPFAPLDRARLATVQVMGLAGGGSGSVVDARGYILTNYHVVEREPLLLIALNSADQDAPPEPAYQANIVASDRVLDLALLQIVADNAGRPLSGALNLVSLPIGDSDQVRLGDEIAILGFPDVGGTTVTLTRGTVAGFIQDDSGNRRGWIKTDAEISPGNSGGAAVNQAGELIGVPSLVSAEDRTLGRIGVLRPINLSRTLFQRMPRIP